MSTQSGKRTANLSITLNKRNVKALQPEAKPFIARVAGSRILVSTACSSIQSSVAVTARSCVSTILSSPPTSAMSDTDLGALSVTSQPGR